MVSPNGDARRRRQVPTNCVETLAHVLPAQALACEVEVALVDASYWDRIAGVVIQLVVLPGVVVFRRSSWDIDDGCDGIRLARNRRRERALG